MTVANLFKHWTYRIFAPGVVLRETYEAFKELLVHDSRCHELMAEFEILYYEGKREDFAAVRKRYDRFSHEVEGMVSCLERMAPGAWVDLREYYRKFDFYVRFLLAPPSLNITPPYVLSLEDPALTPELGGNKAWNLGLLSRELGAPVPDGFVITTAAFNYLLEYNNLRSRIDELLAEIDIESSMSLARISARLQALVLEAEIPPDIREAVLSAYAGLEQRAGQEILVAVRSSAVAEDSGHSFAGQYTSVLGVGREKILDGLRQVLASKYSPQSLFYRITLGLGDEETPMGVLVLTMVDARASGVMYTRDPAASAADRLVIHAIFGLGEPLVSGEALPDIFAVSRKTLEVVAFHPGRHQVMRRLGQGELEDVPIPAEDQGESVLSEDEVRNLGRWGVRIEEYFASARDVEWAVGPDREIFLVQSRPLAVEESGGSGEQEESLPPITVKPLLSGGERASGGVACGEVYRVGAQHTLGDIPEGAILVTENTAPSLVRILSRLGGVVADKGSTAGHFATVCREFGVPLLVGTGEASRLLAHGMTVTLDADNRVVYPGRISLLLANRKRAGRPSREDLPWFKKLRAILDFITPLKLVDPASPDFAPRSCRSLHDIIRFVHEKAVQTMFSLGDSLTGSAGKCFRLQTDLPLDIYLIDVGDGLKPGRLQGDSVTLDQITSQPFLALWEGISHPGIDWHSREHFDWKTYDDVALAGGVAAQGSADLATYAVISRDYLNMNMRFGYHFTQVDALCGPEDRTNYCMLRFAGGGGEFTGRALRIEFLRRVLQELGFEVTVRADLLDGRLGEMDCDTLSRRLDMLGRLLGATKLMDMVLHDEHDVDVAVQAFFQGHYNFSSMESS
ncbi:pyruvate phosphate dikinase PEP/pyruvate binding subunit [Desulfolithobacter dissulfuricans]|uniref:Phosphoenolpyruvate synthase n=1 Tax=Desulfolithobacter dissulfuricans TaxID=2795293 RepID=A0A915TZD1_9BACT|nr:PEP/pyruvate-binding domain-containing protein [Desulfolithobacter dissulfuricans]BCO08626.1 pyruvate phosphate dikinase PEP/pyruvate binding subunit [Desulfolithobacter dissulfuricans]